MTDLAWMKTYIGDEAALTGHLTPEEFGCYERLRRHYWQHNSIPDEEGRLIRITGVDPDRWPAIRSAIEPLFGEGWRLERLDQERSDAAEKREKKIAAGRKGAQSRWGNGATNSNTNADANGKRIAEPMAEEWQPQWQTHRFANSHQHQHHNQQAYESSHQPTRARDTEPTEYPIDPPENADAGRRFLESKGVKPEDMQSKLTKLMAFRLYPSEIAA